ncbi:MAG: peptide-methionine (R)-S-oxide reductase MsrB [Phenylobacterium sp.]|jgi:peptide-methionine (R)-S-oxide reductase|uniref:peptide-methionine (R)-S-oxide reductase MsrB n=1 Tax=Phenylobacterium sp. TaxID=1871053 RepID=UPI002A2AB20D|nr:peptide-methionine (R)-S-oxide reductase MsrB [Phenylobacterium sp.]MDD3836519.1 peptide-methionine (R)-S-oxide reductase MsrB [Phenylobacterium sp.]MDX9999500.1 peptide-methionine (R)-S-oxide reductase MsrB [Phenylobacterium sp.]
MTMDRRSLLLAAVAALAAPGAARGAQDSHAASPWRRISDADWKKRLSPTAYRVLRHEDTERAGTSPLNREKRRGTYVCAACGLALFKSDWKYESGTGWPSFYTVIKDAIGVKMDYRIGVPRKEYHCARCLGHQGHVFPDGPRPTGLRYCNNGVALKFVPA